MKRSTNHRAADAAVASPPDPRLAKLLAALRADAALTPVADAFEATKRLRPGRRLRTNGLKAKNGQLFALLARGSLVVRLPEERVAMLARQGVGKPFDRRGGLMREWLTLTSPDVSCIGLAKEAHAFVSHTSP